MNNISSLTEQTITLVPSAEFCIPVLSFVLCLLHCTVPALSLRADLFLSSVARIRESGEMGGGGKTYFLRKRSDSSDHASTSPRTWCTMYNISRKVTFFALVVLHSSLCTPYMVPVVGFFCNMDSFEIMWAPVRLFHADDHMVISVIKGLILHCIWVCVLLLAAARIFIVIWKIDYERNIRHRGSDQSCHGPRRSLLRLLPISLQFHIGELIFPILGPILDLSQQKNSANIGCCTFTHFDNTFVGETSPIAIRVISSTNQLALGYI